MVCMSDAQKESLYEDGFVVVPGVVPKDMVNRAKRRINQCIGMARRAAMGYQDLGADRHLVEDRAALLDEAGETLEALGAEDVIADLFNESGAIELLESVVGAGAVEPHAAGQMQVLFPPTEDLTQTIGQMGWKNEEVPWYGWGGHLDGQNNTGSTATRRRWTTTATSRTSRRSVRLLRFLLPSSRV